MQVSQSRDMSIALSFGNIAASISAEGVSWSPDVASDMTSRLIGMMRDMLNEAASFGLLTSAADDLVLAIDDEEVEDGE